MEVGMLIVKERLVDQVAVLLTVMLVVVQEQQIKVMLAVLVVLAVSAMLVVVLVKLGLPMTTAHSGERMVEQEYPPL